mmetsp:Transcript_100799/g.178847  ORF Transcript_100799/g.178847 Transcript_100799/m.178847 type:complete len:305 (-) Transcript_100799:67-981(-)
MCSTLAVTTDPTVSEDPQEERLVRSDTAVGHPCSVKQINVLSALSGEHICSLHGVQDLARLKSAVARASQVPEWQQLLILDGQPLRDRIPIDTDEVECTVLLLRKSDSAITMDKMMEWNLTHVIEKRFLEDRDFMLAAVKASGAALKYASYAMRRDPEFVLTAVKRSGAALQYGDPELRLSREFMLSAVGANGSSIVHAAPTLLMDVDFLLAAFQANSEVIGFICNLPQVQNIRRNKDAMLSIVQLHGSALRFASPALRKDREVVRKALRADPSAVRYCAAELRCDPDILGLLAKECNTQTGKL